MKTSNPYGASDTFKTAPETVTSTLGKASSKAKARFPNTPLSPSLANGTTGKMKVRAYTPGTSPAGS